MRALKSLGRRTLFELPQPAAFIAASALLPRLSPDRHIELATLRAILPRLGELERARLLPVLRANALRSLAFEGIIRHGELERLRERVTLIGLEHLPAGPALLLNWHLGPARMVKYALRWHGHEVAVVAASGEKGVDFIRVDPNGGPEHRAAVALAALKVLREGRKVMVMGDGPLGAGGDVVSVLGHHPVIRPGIATLAHQRRVPIVPIWSAWRDRRFEVTIEPALTLDFSLPRPAFVSAAAHTIAAWVDALHRREPTLLTRVHTRWLTRTDVHDRLERERAE